MSRGRRIALVVLAGVLLLAAGSLRWASRPQQVQRLILGQAGRALGLEITAGSGAEYRLRGTPRVVLHDVVARQPGAKDAVFSAKRVDVAVPWSTLRSRGAQLDVQRIELDAPSVDVAALQRWQATRPKSAAPRIPTLQKGLHIDGGTLQAPGWRLEQVTLDLPFLQANKPLQGALEGLAVISDTRVDFDTRIALSKPSDDAGLSLRGRLDVKRANGTLSMQARLTGRLANDARGIGLDAFRYGARSRWITQDSTQPFVLGLAGDARFVNSTLRARPLGIAMHGEGAVPDLLSHGGLRFGKALAFDLDGQLHAWPRAWPALPAPLDRATSPLPFKLAYEGPADLSAVTQLHLTRDATVFDGRFRLPAVLDWIARLDRDTPLPPLDGTLRTPRLDIAGAELEGVHIELHDDAP